MTGKADLFTTGPEPILTGLGMRHAKRQRQTIGAIYPIDHRGLSAGRKGRGSGTETSRTLTAKASWRSPGLRRPRISPYEIKLKGSKIRADTTLPTRLNNRNAQRKHAKTPKTTSPKLTKNSSKSKT